MYLHVKRAIDILLSLCSLVLLSPCFLAISLAIRLESDGPVFFLQKRVGIHKSHFNIMKFRTMRIDTPQNIATHLLKNPQQYITRVGWFLRKTSLDELPQLVNILRGDMSIVGPRPALWNQYDLIEERDRYGVNDVVPGLTGWAQINGRDELEIPVKAGLDGEYVDKRSFLFDARIIFRTVGAVLHSNGNRESEHRMPAGIISNEKEALVVATVASTLDQFCMEDIHLLQKTYKVQVAANFTCGNNTSDQRISAFKEELREMGIGIHEIGFSRNPISKANLTAYRELKRLIGNRFQLIHCHTPVAAMAVRLAARKARRSGTKVLYTAHGFHFYQGAPMKNWLVYYPLERWLARYTDVLITINSEDHGRASSFFQAGRVCQIPGVGIDTQQFGATAAEKEERRLELGIPDNVFAVFSVGELNRNKNHETVIRAISRLGNPRIRYYICGQGGHEQQLRSLIAELNLEDCVKLLGYRQDIPQLLQAADIFAFPSRREGLGLAALEAMATGLPLVTSNIHGIVDYSVNGKTGYSCNPEDIDGFAQAIDRLYWDIQLRERVGAFNRMEVKRFDISNTRRIMEEIYDQTTTIGG